jgi:hypothetical protein
MKKTMVLAVASLAGGAVLASTHGAQAADCSSYTNPVYIAGSSASKPIWAALATHLSGVSIIYQGPSSCVGLSEVTTNVADTSSAVYMDGSANGIACTGTTGAVTIGASDVFPASCGSQITWPASGYADFQGPVQVMVMAVPYASTATAISADAAYTVFGWGGTSYPVSPWTEWQNIFIRSSTSGTETMIGSAIGLAPSKWLSQVPDGGTSQRESGSGAVLAALQAAGAGTSANEAIGILAADFGDTYRGAPGTNDAGGVTGGLKVLAFQSATQTCGYLPDSDATHFDKINVRQGRYDIWGPIHLVAAVDSSGKPTNAGAATILDFVTANGLSDTDYQTLIQADSNAHVIPQCAMQVQRASEVTPVTGGGITSYQPPKGCGCYYESLKNGGSPYSKYCATCSTDTDCKSSSYSKCNFGFCEAQ